jgi:hypothetical protein
MSYLMQFIVIFFKARKLSFLISTAFIESIVLQKLLKICISFSHFKSFNICISSTLHEGRKDGSLYIMFYYNVLYIVDAKYILSDF